MQRKLLSFGHGYSARALSIRLKAKGWIIRGTTRTAEKTDGVASSGADPIVWPGSNIADVLADTTDLLISAGPGQSGDPVLATLRDEISAIAPRLRWVGYLSTTGVYGDHGGAWVDETTPVAPSTQRGQLRAGAEAAWQALATDHGLPLHIFRLAGIYGPGRGPFAKVRAGTARRIIKPGQVFSRIHVEDIARVLEASIAQPNPGAIYNLCDDDPAPPEDVIAYAAKLLGAPLPPSVDFETADMTPMARSFYAESKRVSNQRIKSELGVTLTYPNYRVGLQDLLTRERRTEGAAEDARNPPE
ncbi:MAG: SDR family oxidoreductase [Pseudomonadota bacterium]